MTMVIFPKPIGTAEVPEFGLTQVLQNNARMLVAEDRKISTSKLLKFFHQIGDEGWFTMRFYIELPRYARNKDGQLVHPEFYLITKNLHGIPRKQWPTYNEIASNRFHQEIYGPAILCNSNSVS